MSSNSGVLYIGMTNNLLRRGYEHKKGIIDGFTKKYRYVNLIYYESYKDVNDAFFREKQLKNWNRKKKEFLINKFNPSWKDLYENIK